MLWIFLAIGAAALWAATNLIDADLLEHRRQNPNTLTLVTGIFGSLPILLIPFLGTIPAPHVLVAAIAGGVIGLFVYWPYYQALKYTHTANVVLLWNLAPVFVVFAAWIFLGERLLAREYVAVVLLIASSFLTSYQPGAPHRIPKVAAMWMIFASLVTAVEYTLLGYVFDHLSAVEGIAWVGAGIFIATLAIPLLTPSVRPQIFHALKSLKTRKTFVLNEVLDLSASVLRQIALRVGPVGLVSAVGGLQPLFVLLMSPFFKSKQRPPSRFLAGVAAIVGAVGLWLLS